MLFIISFVKKVQDVDSDEVDLGKGVSIACWFNLRLETDSQIVDNI